MTIRRKLISSFTWEEIIGSMLMGAIVVSVFTGVVTRYLLNRPIFWGEEISLMAFVWLVLLGSSSAFKKNMHVGVDIITRSLDSKLCSVVELVVRILLMFLFLVFIYLGSMLAVDGLYKSTGALKIPYVFIYAAVPLSGLLLFLENVRALINSFKQRGDQRRGAAR